MYSKKSDALQDHKVYQQDDIEAHGGGVQLCRASAFIKIVFFRLVCEDGISCPSARMKEELQALHSVESSHQH